MEKILLLSDPEMDYLHYQLTNGLIQLRGEENVIIYPFKHAYAGEIDDWYYLSDGKRGFTGAMDQGRVWKDLPRWGITDVVHAIKNGAFEFIVLSSARTYAIKALEEIKEMFGRIPLPIVFCDSEDYTQLRRDILEKYHPICYFKRELLDTEENKKFCSVYPIYPLPFSAITDHVPIEQYDLPAEEKDIDVFFAAGLTYEIRERIVLLLDEMRKEEGIMFVGGTDPPPKGRKDLHFRENYDNYCKLMGRARINLTARGFGQDTVRRWEVACYSGEVMADNLYLQTPFPFTGGENIVYYDNDLSNLKALIRYYLKNEKERIKIGKAGKEHCFKFHTTRARAKYFLERVVECLKLL